MDKPMTEHNLLSSVELMRKLRRKEIVFGGNKKLKIYGTLQCCSGKRLKQSNRVFFGSRQEAIANNYRPCAHCMHNEYLNWKLNKNNFNERYGFV